MTPSKDVIQATLDWLIENDQTPHLMVDATLPGNDLPQGYITNGQITLNLRPAAIESLHIGDHSLSFRARFGGIPRDLYVEYSTITALYSKENKEGFFSSSTGIIAPEPKPKHQRPKLSIVK